MSFWCIYVCHLGWTRVDDCVASLGSLRCGVISGRRRDVLRVSMLVRSWRSDAYCPLFGSLASIASVFRMWSSVLGEDNFVVVRIVLHLWVPVAHRGAKCLRSVLE